MKILSEKIYVRNLRSPSIRVLGSILFIFILSVTHLYAQESIITGKVVSKESGESLPGVNILIKGTTTGVITGIDGNFEISVKPEDVLVISFIGYNAQEIAVGSQTNIEVILVEDYTELDEVVVVGYGIQKKKLVTGATSQVKSEDIGKRNSTAPLQALQGQAAGVNITSTSGQPGESMKVTIRGVGTTGNSTPLYIVDGIQTEDIGFLNPSDIESMDILKDAASSAIYGSRAANGVILITTKSGKAGKSQVTFDAYYGIQNLANKIDMLGTKDYAMIMNEQHLNSGGTASSLPFDMNDLPAYTANGVANTDWVDEMFVKNAMTQNYVIGASGGTEQTVYSMSVAYTGQEGIAGGSDYSNYERYTGRLNAENELYDGRLKIGEHLSFSYVNKNGIDVGNQYNNSLRGAFNVSPLLPVYDDDGDFFNTANTDIVDQNGETYWYNGEANPYAYMAYNSNNEITQQKLIGDVYAEFKILKNLKFRTSIGFEHYTADERSYTPAYDLSIYSFKDYNEATQKMEKKLGLKWDNLITYDFTKDKHKFDFMAGTSVERYTGEWLYVENANVAFDDLDHAYIDNTTNEEYSKMSLEGAPDDEDKLLSFFGRVQYNYNEKYMLNTTLRADGSSKFAEGNRWGYFPSVSVGWVLTSEPFMLGIGNYVQFFKLRGSWGQNGSSNVTAFQYLSPIKFTQATYPFGTDETSSNGSYPSRLDNTDLKWETSEQTDIGFDARLFDSKVVVNFDWYYKSTKDWLVKAPVLATAGTDAPWINGGNVINKGVELVLGYQNHDGELKYSINVNGAYNKNKVTDIPTEDGVIHGADNSLYDNSEEFYRAETDHPIGYFWGWETDGIFQNTTEINSYTHNEELIQPDAEPGDLRYVDRNNDGQIDDDDKTDLGDPNPDFMYGASINLSYKGFDFSIVGNGVAGNQIVQSYRNHSNQYANYTTEILGRWTGEGTSNTIPRVTNANVNYMFSDLFVKDGSYFRISNVTLGFELTSVLKIPFVSQFRIYGQVQNLYTFTNYTGMDPEVGYGLDNGDEDQFSYGIDLGYYPRPRTILFGVNMKF